MSPTMCQDISERIVPGAKRIRAAQCTLKTILGMHILIRNIFDIT